MFAEELRLECLRLALADRKPTVSDTIRSANAYANFVLSGKVPEDDVKPPQNLVFQVSLQDIPHKD